MTDTATYDFFLVYPAATYRIAQLRSVGLEAIARLVGVDLYYRADTDLALIGLRIDARTATHTLLQRLRDEAETAGAAFLEPARLEADERGRFYAAHLSTYPLRAYNFPTVADAARKLAADLGVRADLGAGQTAGPRRIEVRIRRNAEWLLGRVRSLTREGVYVYSGCAPRIGDVLDIQLGTSSSNLS